MKRKLLWVAVALILADGALVTHARASRRYRALGHVASVQPAPLRVQQYYPMMMVHVTEPIQLPDQVLMPGEYSFTMIHEGNNVSIAKADGKFMGTYIVVPAWRRDASSGLVNTADAPDGGPDRLVAWFFPDQQDGYGFLYPTS